MTLSRASLDFISRKVKRKSRRVEREERVGPTPETAAKLIPDPIVVMHKHGLLENEDRDAAIEIRAVYMAVVGALMPKARSEGGGRAEISPRLAWAHTHRYKPWADALCRRDHAAHELVTDAVIDGRAPGTIFANPDTGAVFACAKTEAVAAALKAYAKMRRDRPMPREIEA